MDAFAAGRLTRALDALHSVVYFVPDANEKFGEIGLNPRTHYFAGRAAPMGAVSANVVAATFYNFSPRLVGAAIPHAWQVSSPAQVMQVRYQIVATALPRVLGEHLAGSPDLARAATLLRQVAESVPDVAGRPLYAGHAGLPWPETPVVALWHAITLLREYRGDGHIAALVTSGLTGLQALITHTATGIGFDPEVARGLRGWSHEEWAAATETLASRGVLGADGALTPAGTALRSQIEDRTDELGFSPWRGLSASETEELVGFAGTIRAAVLAAGVYPPGIFGPRYGQAR